MNSDWEPWGVAVNGNTTEGEKSFWQYVVTRFRSAGASNVSWIWSPNTRFYDDPCSYSQIYPGDNFVDFVGLDGYNWGTTQSWSTWQSFSDVFGQSYNELTRLTGKKILIMEVSSAESGGSKAQWITDMFSDLRTKFPQIQGFTWFSINKETDWRIDSSQNAKIAFANGSNGIGTSGSTSTNSPATVSSQSANKKGSKDFQISVNDPAPSASDIGQVENTSVNSEVVPVVAVDSGNVKSSGSVFGLTSKSLGLISEHITATLFLILNCLFLLLVFLVNHQERRTHLRSKVGL